jgi:tetratricopeptide (TPR) repeat protein
MKINGKKVVTPDVTKWDQVGTLLSRLRRKIETSCSRLFEPSSSSKLMPVCEACSQEGATKCCSGCKESYYCGIVCQRRHWKQGHKHKCVKAEKPSVATAAVEPLPTAAGGAAQGSGGGAGASHGEECTICLDALQQPQTMPCGHRFCRGCVASMRRHGAAVAQVCPLCRGAMPDAKRLRVEASVLVARQERWQIGKLRGASLPAAVQALLGKAVALCRGALAIDPSDADALCTLGYALSGGGDNAGAEAAYRTAIAADPQYIMAHCNLGFLLKQRGDNAGAETAYRAAIAADLQHANAHYNLGIVLEQREDKAGAEATYRAAIAADPRHVKAHFNLGAVLDELGDTAGAEAAWRAAIAADPQFTDAANIANAHFNLADIMGERGDKAGEVAAYCAAIAADPQVTDAHYNLGICLADRGDMAGAEAAYRAAIAAHPQDAKAYYNLGVLLDEHGDHADAARSFAAALKINPSHIKVKVRLQRALRDTLYA